MLYSTSQDTLYISHSTSLTWAKTYGGSGNAAITALPERKKYRVTIVPLLRFCNGNCPRQEVYLDRTLLKLLVSSHPPYMPRRTFQVPATSCQSGKPRASRKSHRHGLSESCNQGLAGEGPSAGGPPGGGPPGGGFGPAGWYIAMVNGSSFAPGRLGFVGSW